MKNFHIAIIGGGVIGSAIARELSRYELDIILFEKESDVASSTSKANSGVIHSGINSPPKSLKAHFCVEGNKIFQSLAEELSVPVKFTGKYIIARNEEEIKDLIKLKKNGIENNVKGLRLIEAEEINSNEPNISSKYALFVPSAGITLPYQLTIALAENSIINGVKFLLETKIIDINNINNKYNIKTNNGLFKSDFIINAAGLNCRDIVQMLEEPDFKVYPCRGEYLVLDKNCNSLIKKLIYPIPQKKYGFLGIHITPTIDGNILLGPTFEYINNINDTKTTKEKMNLILKEVKEIIPSVNEKAVINAYSGIRCKISPPEYDRISDFRVENSKINPGLINLLGIESPGLSAAPAIAKEVVKIISKNIELSKKTKFISKYEKYKKFSDMTNVKKSKIIKRDTNWGRIICRCENVTEAEVINALSNPLGAKTLSSVKYRCRAGMGRCQGGFCTQHIIRIMEEKFNLDRTKIKLKSQKSNLFIGKIRE
ncbi:MAG: NAD(P)/FAD-dependent oxidoreductase [Candidatus Thermoplasmatota archaeon]|nr:NAD(P)/FAD-dependent oxidoreductase [Candidatus Thermoplasmatota archaeon]